MAFESSLGVIRLVFLLPLLIQLSRSAPITRHMQRNLLQHQASAQKRQGGIFSVLGVGPLTDNTVQARLEIRELENHKDQWNVFLLGLRRLQGVRQDEKTSYYQIAGT